MIKQQSWIDQIFQDNTGKYVIYQPPNLPIYLIIIGFLGELLVAAGPFHQMFSLLSFGAVFLWSYLEIRFGESLFRRVLGGAIMIAAFLTRLV